MGLGRKHVAVGVASVAALGIAVAALQFTRVAAGPIVRTASLAQQPISALVDERSGRTFVLTADGPNGLFPQNSDDPHGNGHVWVFDTATGELLHVQDAGYRPCAIAADERTGRVFVAVGAATAGAGAVLMLDARSGHLLRTSPTGAAPCGSAPVVDPRRGDAFFGGNDDSLSTVDARTGRLLYTVQASRTGDISLGGMSLAVDGQSGRVFAALPNSGAIDVFVASGGRHPRTIPFGRGAPLLGLAVPPGAGRLFVINQTASTVSMLDARTYVVRRVSAVAPNPTAWMLAGATSGRRLLVGGDSMLSILDTRTGAVVHTLTLGEQARQILADGRLQRAFVISADNLGVTPDVRVVDIRMGRLLTTIRLPGVPLSAAFDGRHDRLVVADQQGMIDIVDARTDRLVHTYRSVPSTLASVTIDAARGRAVVLHGRGIIAVPDRWSWIPSWLRAKLPFLPRQSASYQDAPAGITIVDDTR